METLPVLCLDDFESFWKRTEEFDRGFYDPAVPAVTRYSSNNEQTNFLNVEDSLSQGQRQLFYQSLPSLAQTYPPVRQLSVS